MQIISVLINRLKKLRINKTADILQERGFDMSGETKEYDGKSDADLTLDQMINNLKPQVYGEALFTGELKRHKSSKDIMIYTEENGGRIFYWGNCMRLEVTAEERFPLPGRGKLFEMRNSIVAVDTTGRPLPVTPKLPIEMTNTILLAMFKSMSEGEDINVRELQASCEMAKLRDSVEKNSKEEQ